ncbi:MAG TPA: SMR family transporter [Candidatus Nanoarchaeia archaeon]|nr:SMR family transporter [Candidatus Nanoarchaeia archaeon]
MVLLKYGFWLFLILAVLLEVIADVLFKKWSLENKNLLLVLGLFLYFIGTVFWAFSLKYEYLSKAISVFTVLNLVIITLVGVVLFKEHLSLVNKIGVLLGILSVGLIEWA